MNRRSMRSSGCSASARRSSPATTTGASAKYGRIGRYYRPDPCAALSPGDGRDDFDDVAVRQAALTRPVEQHLVVHGEVEHRVVELFLEAGYPRVERVHQLRDGPDGLLERDAVVRTNPERSGQA